MNRAVFCCLVGAALAVALGLRLPRPDARPMHHDEANQAVKFGALLETGEYRYDRVDHHGPTLYYLTLPIAWARGQRTFASLDERTLRLVPTLFGTGLILLLPLLVRGLGRGATAASALLVAVSPAFTYYSRFYIQESVFVFFGLGFLIALGRYLTEGGTWWAVTAGLFAGLALATKETSVIVLGAALTAAVLARWLRPGNRATGGGPPPTPPAGRVAREGGARPGGRLGLQPPGASPGLHAGDFLMAVGAAAAIVFVLYSSFLTYPRGPLEGLGAARVYAGRGLDPGAHRAAWYYYLELLGYWRSNGLTWSEASILALAAAGIVVAWRRSNGAFWPCCFSLYTLMAVSVFSALPYKTPWNLLPFHAGFVVMAGIGANALIGGARSRPVRALAVLAVGFAVCHLGVESWRANFRYPADPRNPYVYAQTTPDFLRLVTRISDLAALHPDRLGMLVKVVAGPYEQWPLPWYLRHMPRVGYWPTAADAVPLDDAPVIVSSQENAPAVDAAVGDRYVSEFYGLRPNVLLTVYIRQTLWDRFIHSR